MHTGTPIHLPVLVKDPVDLFGQVAIFSLVGTRFSGAPLIIPTDTDSKRSAQRADRILLAVLGDEWITQSWLREKMAKAFFRMSRSCLVTSNSRFIRRISSS